MKEKRTSVFENGLIWFGAGVSIAEILTGMYFAPLGFENGLLAIIIGHVIGCVLLFFAGLIGAKKRKSAMETVKMSFGQKGSVIFSVINIVQLVGWTSIMIYDGALAAGGIFDMGKWAWCLIIGGLIIVWLLIGLKKLGKVNIFAIAALFVLTVILSITVFSSNTASPISEGITFGAAVELAVAMPLSWLPLISDYTKDAEKPYKATAVSAITYGLVSTWMYIIGMGVAMFTGESDISSVMIKAGLGIAGLLIIVFSTVTTTFLDAYSAGVSSLSLLKRSNVKIFAIITAAAGTALACIFPMDDITDFLYFIGSVFAPMIAILITDHFILKKDISKKSFGIKNIVIWACGFVVYRLFMNIDIALGSTIAAMGVTVAVCIAAAFVERAIKKP